MGWHAKGRRAHFGSELAVPLIEPGDASMAGTASSRGMGCELCDEGSTSVMRVHT